MDPATHEIPGMKCGSCGYSLEGLDWDGRCPECGLDIASSVRPIHRGPVPGRYTRRLALGFLAMAAGNAAGVAGFVVTAALAFARRGDERLEMAFWACLIMPTAANAVGWTLASADEDRAWRAAPGRMLAVLTATLTWVALLAQCLVAAASAHLRGGGDDLIVVMLVLISAHAVKAISGLLALRGIGRQFAGPASAALPVGLACLVGILLAVMYPPFIATGWAMLTLMQAALARRLFVFNWRARE